MVRYYTDEVTSYRYTVTVGSGGEKVKSWTTSVTVIGSFQNVSGDWNVVNDQEAFRKRKKFYCPVVDIIDKDYIYYGNKTYDILDVQNIWNHHLEIELESRSTG